MLVSIKHQHESATGLPMSPPTWTSLSLSSPTHPSRLLLRPGLSSLSHIENSHRLSILHMVISVSMLLHTSHPLPPPPAHRVHKSVLNVCVSTAVLKKFINIILLESISEKAIAPQSSTFAWKIHGWGNLVGCRLWGRIELDTTEATQQQQQQQHLLPTFSYVSYT